jgi:esterase/lipase superfamily enzyme
MNFVAAKGKFVRANSLRRLIFVKKKIDFIYAHFRSKVNTKVKKMRFERCMSVFIRGFIKSVKQKYASVSIEMRNERRIKIALTFGGFLLNQKHFGCMNQSG